MYLSDCLQRTAVKWALMYHFSTEVKIAEARESWSWGFQNFLSPSPLCQLAPPPWLSTLHPIHTNAKISKWPKSYQCLNYCDKVELMWESPYLCECFTVWMEFLWECMKEGEQLKNEWWFLVKWFLIDCHYNSNAIKLQRKLNIFKSFNGICWNVVNASQPITRF